MKDKLIIKIISEIYASIVTLFSFIVLFLIFLFFVLQNGLYLDNLHISNFYLKNSYIRVDNQLHIVIDDLKITPQKKSTQKVNLKEINNYIKLFSYIMPYIGSVTISKIEVNGFQANFDYSSKNSGLLHIYSKNILDCNALLSTKNGNLAMHIQDLNSSRYKTHINGDIVIDTTTLKQYTKLNILLNHDANLTLYALSNQNHLLYNIKSHNDIHNIKALLNLIPFNQNVKYWANDAIKAKYVTIKKANGELNFNDIVNGYKQIHLEAVIHSLQYRYNPKLATINSKQTILQFNNGILSITPKEAYTYNTYLKNSWLQIDFTKKHELLDLYLHLDGQLNDNILHLLSLYKIVLPFKQNSGITKTDLHLSIDLRTIDVAVDGDFSIKKANIDYTGVNLNIFNSHIHLHNNDVSIDKMHIKYKNILDTNLTATYNVITELGDIRFQTNSVNYKGLELNNSKSKLCILYHLSKEKKFLQLSKSQWKYKNQEFLVHQFSMPYDVKDATINLAQAFVSGNINVKNKHLNFDINIFKLFYKNFNMKQKHIYLQAKYNSIFTLKSKNNISIFVNDLEYKIKKLKMIFDDKSVKLQDTSIKIGKYLSSDIDAKHLFNSNKVDIGLHNFELKNQKTHKVFYHNKKTNLQLFLNDKNITVQSNNLDTKFFSNKKGWKFELLSLNKIAKNSNILKELNISKGSINFYQKSTQTNINFQANIISPYSILMNQNRQIHNYQIIGKITKDKKISMNLNKSIQIKVNNKININPKNCTINIHEIIKLVKAIQKTQTKTKSSTPPPKIYLNAINSSIYIGKNRYILSDTIDMHYLNNIITAQLVYKKGHASFRLAHNKFNLYGKNFNDKFMEDSSGFSKFKGGKLDFSIHGTFNNYSGLFLIKKTTMLDYRLLNNILAFVNTIPSLVTFSLPNYNKDGLYVQDAYLDFSSKNGLMNIKEFYLNSKELKIAGKGTANIKQNKINLLLNLKTDLASDVSKIPLVGYLIFDGKSLSTTLKVTGKLDNPTIKTQIVKDIVVAPFNIIKRTLSLPYMLIKKAVNDINGTHHQ
ncbi:FIG01209130: hypothetical protein [hydrothermal vent metagenome]|uniref:YhdP central domain-containing protein n=1 Tax=hydrothermal vent metagenome TaxID=652676 RepID=A0A1W1CPP1_9ZZZZ